MSYRLTPADLMDAYRQRHMVELVGHYGSGFHREIKFDYVDDTFVVLDHHVQILRTEDPDEAVQRYNTIQSRG